MRLGFRITGKTCGRISVYLLKAHFEKKFSKGFIWWCLCFFLIFFIKAYVVDTHLNCIDKSMQFKWVPTTYAFVKKQTKSTLSIVWRIQHCLTALIGVYAVIRPNAGWPFLGGSSVVVLLWFVRQWFHMWRLFCHCLFLISPSFGASGRPCVVVVVISGYLPYMFETRKASSCLKKLLPF